MLTIKVTYQRSHLPAALTLVVLALLLATSFPAYAQTRTVDKSKILLLSVRDYSSRRYTCDGSVVPAKLGILKSQTSTSVQYGRPTAGKSKSKAQTECRRKVAKRTCGDGLDNDGDGKKDFPDDSDCQSLLGISEGTALPLPPSSSTPRPVPPDSFALFTRPFKTTFATSNFFDHDVPREFVDKNGYSRIATGETIIDNIDGHQGYDFDMPEGTEILAAGDGVVDDAGVEAPFFCPLLNKNTSGNFVRIRHDFEQGTYYSLYLHFSRVDVRAGQVVTAGTVLGLSGNTGCSTGPHLHFDIKQTDSSNRFASVDPFGWSGTDTDPWTLDPKGLPSTYLWKSGQEPEVYREVRLPPNPGTGDAAPVTVTVLRTMGFADASNPNNEFVEPQVDPRFAKTLPYNLSGFYILSNNGERFDIPDGTTLTTGQTLTIKVGSGEPLPNTLYWNRPSGIFDNNGDCARLFRKDGFRMYYLFYGGNGCTGVSQKNIKARKLPRTRDMVSPAR